MGNYFSNTEEKFSEEKIEFPDPHSGYKDWVRYQYNLDKIQRFNNIKGLCARNSYNQKIY